MSATEKALPNAQGFPVAVFRLLEFAEIALNRSELIQGRSNARMLLCVHVAIHVERLLLNLLSLCKLALLLPDQREPAQTLGDCLVAGRIDLLSYCEGLQAERFGFRNSPQCNQHGRAIVQ